jgi:hypothetical protein
MEVLGIRYCSVTAEAAALIRFFAALGMPKTDYAEEGILGSVVPNDADAFAAHARKNELGPEGPTLAVLRLFSLKLQAPL